MFVLFIFYHPPQYYALYYKIFVIMAMVEYVCIYICIFVMIYKVQKKNLCIKWCKNLIIGIICIYVKGILYPISLRD